MIHDPARLVAELLHQYRRQTPEIYVTTDDLVVGFLTDLQHLCAKCEICFEACVKEAQSIFELEYEDPEEPPAPLEPDCDRDKE
jgi:hypothetical protein